MELNRDELLVLLISLKRRQAEVNAQREQLANARAKVEAMLMRLDETGYDGHD